MHPSSPVSCSCAYIYSMPVERIIKLFAEHGFEMNKATAHGLIKKAAGLFDLVEDVLKETVLSDNYLSMDESYYTVLTSDTNNSSGKSTAKGYIGAALANHLKLVHFFLRKRFTFQKDPDRLSQGRLPGSYTK